MVWFGWCPWIDSATMVKINITPITKITVILENAFIVIAYLPSFTFGTIKIIKKTIPTSIDLFCFLFSFADIEAVYMNKVIIPDEKVRIVTNAIHLVIVLLKMTDVENKDRTKIEIARKIGFNLFINLMVRA